MDVVKVTAMNKAVEIVAEVMNKAVEIVAETLKEDTVTDTVEVI